MTALHQWRLVEASEMKSRIAPGRPLRCDRCAETLAVGRQVWRRSSGLVACSKRCAVVLEKWIVQSRSPRR